MLLLLMIPVLVAVAAFQRYLAIYAPSNVVIRHARSSPACRATALKLAAIAVGLILVMHAVQLSVHSGAPNWLILVVLILAWDAIKVGALSIVTAYRWGASAARRRARSARIAKPHQTGITLG